MIDPVAIDWGPDGKLWVAEMADYPSGIDGQGKPGGRIRYLEDSNGDGQYDRSMVFLSGVNFPTGVMAWKQGVLVTAAPELFYAEDTDGDGRADHREVLYSGFVTANQQLRVNGLRYGLDNWIYCASGAHNPNFGKDRGIKAEKLNKLIPLGSRDFRIRPETGQLDPQSGPSQFGRDRDDWGNWFGVQNAHPLWHYALADHYLRRNPHFVPPDARVEVIAGEAPRIYSAKTPQKRFHSFHLSNRFTSACGISIYRDELLYPRSDRESPLDERKIEQHSFTCAPFHNLVHHAVLTRTGVTFTARRAKDEQTGELFASRDRWCRPVMTRTGPDGALWVVDMYRYMIEHPQFLSDEGRAELKPHFRAGDDRGRIYRVYRRDRPPRTWSPIDKMSTRELVKTLYHPNGILRDLAQRQLIELKDEEAVELLAAAAQGANSLGRLHALCTLDALEKLDFTILWKAIQDSEAAVRRHAVRIAGNRGEWGLLKFMLDRMGIPEVDAQVRQQLAYSLRGMSNADSSRLLVQYILPMGPADKYIQAAAFSSLHEQNIELALAHLHNLGWDSDHFDECERELLMMAIVMRRDAPPLAALNKSVTRHAKFPQLTSAADWLRVAVILDGYDKREGQVLSGLPAEDVKLLAAMISDATDIVVDQDKDVALRAAAAGLLFRQHDRRKADLATTAVALSPQAPLAVQMAAIARVAAQRNADVAEMLLANWSTYGPTVRREILRQLTSRPTWIALLLSAVEEGDVPRSDIGAVTLQKLRWVGDEELRSRVRALLKTASEDRQAVVDEYDSVLRLSGDIERGRVVFNNRCATCHRDGELGHDVGPRLAAISDRTPRGLVVSVLDPNRVVDSRYINYVAITKDGRSFAGVLAAETSVALTLREADGKEHTLLRSQLEELQSTGKSLMPEGLEKELTPQNLADVISFVTRPQTAVSATLEETE